LTIAIAGCGGVNLPTDAFGDITRLAPSPLQGGLYTGDVSCEEVSRVAGEQSTAESTSELTVSIGPDGLPVAGGRVLRPGRTQSSEAEGLATEETFTDVVIDSAGVIIDADLRVESTESGNPDTESGIPDAEPQTGFDRTSLIAAADGDAIDYTFDLRVGSASGSGIYLNQHCQGILTRVPGSENQVACDDCGAAPGCLTCAEYEDELVRLRPQISPATVCQVLDVTIDAIECGCCEDSPEATCESLLSDFQQQRLLARCP
jgi:hypothetical protein